MAVFNTVWSIDIGKFSFKAVHLRKTGSQVLVLKTDRIEYEIGSEGVDSIGGPKEALQIFTSRNSVHDPVVVSIQGRDALPRFIKITADNDKKLQELINFEARQQIPFDINDVVWDWHLVPRDYEAGQEKEIGIFAARREAVDDVLLDLAGNNIKAQMVVPGYLGLLNYIMYEIRPKTPSIILDVGANHTSLILVENNAFWVRELTFSGNKVTQELARRFGLSFSEAERLKCQAAKSKQAQKIYTALQNVLKNFATEIRQSVGHYRRTQDNETEFKNIYLLGQGSYTLGLGKFLKDNLGFSVQRINKLNRMRGGDGSDIALIRQQLPSMATALGVGLQGLGMAHTSVDLMPHEQQIELAFRRRRKLVFVAGAILLFIMYLVGHQYDKDISRVKSTIGAAQSKYDSIQKYQKKLPSASNLAMLKKECKAISQIGKERHYLTSTLLEVDKVLKKVSQDAFDSIQFKSKNLAHLTNVKTEKEASIFLTRQATELEAIADAKAFADELQKKTITILSLELSLTGFEEGGSRSSSGRIPNLAAAGKKIEPMEYTFKLTGAIFGKDTTTESLKEVRKRFIEPLKQAFKSNMLINPYLVKEPEPVNIDEPVIMKRSPKEPDKLFSSQWYLVNSRVFESKNKKKSLNNTGSMITEIPQYFKFKIEWVIGEGKQKPADNTTTTPVEE